MRLNRNLTVVLILAVFVSQADTLFATDEITSAEVTSVGANSLDLRPTSTAQNRDTLSGKYEGVARSDQLGDIQLTINIKNDNGKLTGTIETPQGAVSFVGTFVNSKIQVKFDAGGNEGTITATFDGTKIIGKWELGGPGGPIELGRVEPLPPPPPPPPIPQFPWPPPKASAFLDIPRNTLAKVSGRTLLKDVSDRLNTTLSQAGYREKSWYAIPSGFALVTRLEQFQRDGVPLPGEGRWSVKIIPKRPGNLAEYIAALFGANPGFYRVIVFTVTNVPTIQLDKSPDRDEALSWLQKGANAIPMTIGNREFSVDYLCTAYIYEFEQRSADDEALLNIPSNLSADTHLEKSGIWGYLRK